MPDARAEVHVSPQDGRQAAACVLLSVQAAQEVAPTPGLTLRRGAPIACRPMFGGVDVGIEQYEETGMVLLATPILRQAVTELEHLLEHVELDGCDPTMERRLRLLIGKLSASLPPNKGVTGVTTAGRNVP